jgi:hypothetical protein
MLADPERATYYAYENAGTPGAILVGVDGRITRPLVVAAQGIHDLVEELTGVVIPALEIGREMPDVDLPALDGGRVQTASLRGYETVLLFWQPLTEKCQALHKDIVAWEEQAVAEPRLVIVTFGEADDMRAEGFRSTVLLDAELALSPLLRGIGMPAAVLFDREGRVAWPLADGADHILRLLRSRSLGPPAREPLEMV